MDANLDARIGLDPKKSQIFVTTFAIFSGLAFAIGCLFLWFEKSDAWIPYLFSVGFAAVSAMSWLISHRNTDLHGARPTKIAITQDEIRVEADPRTLAANHSYRLIEQVISMLGHRAPLPEPDGMMSAAGKPQPERKLEAVAIANRANEESQLIAQRTTELLSAACAPIEQQPTPEGGSPEDISGISRNEMEA